MAQTRQYPQEQIELDPLAYGPKRLRHDVRGMSAYRAEVTAGYGASVGAAVLKFYGSIDGVTIADELKSIILSALPDSSDELDVQAWNWVIPAMTTSGTSGVIWVTAMASDPN